jgi:hypothetical protein
MVKVRASIPTSHLVFSLLALVGTNVKEYPDGSLVFEQEFNNPDEAKHWMQQRAWKIAETMDDYNDMLNDINVHGSFRYEGVGCYIDQN